MCLNNIMNLTFENIEKNIESFDLLCTTSTSIFSKIIKITESYVNGMGGIYSHVALCIRGDMFTDETIIKDYKIDKDKVYLLESVRDTKEEVTNIFGVHYDGVQLREFDKVIMKYQLLAKKGCITNVGLAKLNDDSRKKFINLMNNDHKKIMTDEIISHLDTPYNFNYIDQVYVAFHNYRFVKFLKNVKSYTVGQSNSLLCSQFIGILMKKIGLIENDINCEHILPEDFLPTDDGKTYDFDKEIPLLFDKPIELVTEEFMEDNMCKLADFEHIVTEIEDDILMVTPTIKKMDELIIETKEIVDLTKDIVDNSVNIITTIEEITAIIEK